VSSTDIRTRNMTPWWCCNFSNRSVRQASLHSIIRRFILKGYSDVSKSRAVLLQRDTEFTADSSSSSHYDKWLMIASIDSSTGVKLISGITFCFVPNLMYVLTSRLTPKLEGHPLSAVRDCVFNIFAATLHIWRPSPLSATWGRAMPWWQWTHLTWLYKTDKSI
jgi:hypothetical protein